MSVPEIPELEAMLWSLLEQIPYGRVTTYGDLARALGDVKAARWVGEVLRDHPHNSARSNECPCHRVVRRNGDPGLYATGDAFEKLRRLELEGVETLTPYPTTKTTPSSPHVDLKRFGFYDFECAAPLKTLAEFQETLPEQIQIAPWSDTPAFVGGVDVSYIDKQTAVAAYVVVETSTGRLIDTACIKRPVRFPYISGYLAFREIPLYLELFAEVRRRDLLTPVVFVDGNGILHHRRAGIASHLGVAADVRTIGVGKKLQCGKVVLGGLTARSPRPIIQDGEPVGVAMKAGDESRPVFVSPGHRIDVANAARLTRMLFHGHRVPEPIYHADRVSREAK